jgi:RIO kinase 1
MSNRIKNIQIDQLESLEELSAPAARVRHVPHTRPPKPHKPRPIAAPQPEMLAKLAEQNDDRGSFDFTYKASRYERGWLTDSLGGFFEAHWFDDVLRMVKGGKEASVYLCQANPTTHSDYLAAKVYRPRQFRNLKNDHLYREGRINLDANGHVIKDDRANHAMAKKTEYGMELLHTSWIEHEFLTLEILHKAGVDVPLPYTRANNAILMGYIGDLDLPAPALIDVELTHSEARQLFQRVLHNIELMLANDRIHGDLSAFNILYWDGDITLIDFPQAMHPDQSPNTYRIFERDVTRVCEYFAGQGVHSKPSKLASDLWTGYQHRVYPEVDPHFLDDQSEEDRRYWERQSKTR